MLITWKQNLKHLSYEEYHFLRRLCRLSKNVYNEALYNIRQHYFEQSEFLRYEANWILMKDSENYQTIGGSIAQQTMKCADQSFKSFFGLIKLMKKGQYESWKVRLPKYLPKDGYYPLTFVMVNDKIRDNQFVVPVSRILRKETDVKLTLRLPKKLEGLNIHQIRIIPKYNGTAFEVRYVFDVPGVELAKDLEFDKALGIDFGVDNFATCATSDGQSFIIDGRKIKSINQWYSKECARLSSIKDKQHTKKLTKLQYRKSTKRNRQIADFIYCAAKYVINYCLTHHIGNIVVGYNEGFQDDPNLSKRVNQLFCTMPYGKFKNRLEYLCNQCGINYRVQEESYTSKASFFDQDIMPTWVPNKPKQGEFTGKRIYRGLYQRSNGKTLNADVNGALNIIRKSNVVDLSGLYSRGDVMTPSRIRLA